MEAKKVLWNIVLGVGWEQTFPGRLAASHSDAINDIHFVMATIWDFHL